MIVKIVLYYNVINKYTIMIKKYYINKVYVVLSQIRRNFPYIGENVFGEWVNVVYTSHLIWKANLAVKERPASIS